MTPAQQAGPDRDRAGGSMPPRAAALGPSHAELGEAPFVEVFQRNAGALLRVARRLVGSQDDAEEIVQEALLRAYADMRRRFRQPRETEASLYRIAHNLSVDLLRRKRMRLIDSSLIDLRAAPWRRGVEDEAEHEQLREAVRRAVSDLPEKYRKVVALRFGAGLSYRAIQRALRLSRPCLETRVFRAKRMLKKSLAPWIERPRG